eukprot:7386928-Prymnesium_polylepis.1
MTPLQGTPGVLTKAARWSGVMLQGDDSGGGARGWGRDRCPLAHSRRWRAVALSCARRRARAGRGGTAASRRASAPPAEGLASASRAPPAISSDTTHIKDSSRRGWVGCISPASESRRAGGWEAGRAPLRHASCRRAPCRPPGLARASRHGTCRWSRA